MTLNITKLILIIIVLLLIGGFCAFLGKTQVDNLLQIFIRSYKIDQKRLYIQQIIYQRIYLF